MRQQGTDPAGDRPSPSEPGRARVLLLDVPLALVLAGATWSTLVLSRLPPSAWSAGPPWTQGAAPGPRRWPAWEGVEPPWALGAVLLGVAAAVALRRLRPLPAFLAVVTGSAVLLAAGAPFGPLCLGAALSLLALAGSGPVRAWAPWALLLVPMLALGWWPFGTGELTAGNLSATTLSAVVLTVAALLGVLGRSRRQSRERAHAEELRQSADAERLRIAREVHDLVGHSLTVITMQAGVALHVVNRRPEQAEESLRAIRRTGLEAMAELRATLQVFREDGPDPSAAPGLARLGELARELRAAGRVVELDVAGDLGALPPSLEHACFRIVQESLTNVGKHAPEAGATVRVVREDDTRPGADHLRVEVLDDGPARPGAVVRPGHGITGMRERALALGGTLAVTPRPEGGVLVLARFPLEPR